MEPHVDMINTGKIWHSPLNVYWHIQKLTEKVGADAIEKQNKYKSVREARVGAVMALVMFKRLNKPTYLQLYKPDPPDVILMQPSKTKKGQLDITLVEITSYIREPKESLLDQLKRNKIKPGISNLSENYILAINIGIGLETDYEPLRDYLNANIKLFPYPIWTFQQISSYPDTIARVVIVNPEIITMDVNIGESAHLWKEAKLPGVINTKRIANPDLVRYEKSDNNYSAPWEEINQI
jgi:hypothetical protein